MLDEIGDRLDAGCQEEAALLMRELFSRTRSRIEEATPSWDVLTKAAYCLMRLRPETAVHWINYSCALRYSKGTEAARAVMELAAEKFPGHGEIRYALACYQVEAGEVEAAKENLGLALLLDPSLKALALQDGRLDSLWEYLLSDQGDSLRLRN